MKPLAPVHTLGIDVVLAVSGVGGAEKIKDFDKQLEKHYTKPPKLKAASTSNSPNIQTQIIFPSACSCSRIARFLIHKHAQATSQEDRQACRARSPAFQARHHVGATDPARRRGGPHAGPPVRRYACRQSVRPPRVSLERMLSAMVRSVLIWPHEGVGAVSVTHGDKQRLRPEEFLNDTLIELGLKCALYFVF